MSTIEHDRSLLETFERMSALAPDEREIQLEKLSKEEPSLHARIQSYFTSINTGDVLMPLNLDTLKLDMGQPQLIGSTLDNRYVVESQIGEGGMGVVYKARDTNLERVVALKVVRTNLSVSGAPVIRLMSENRLLAKFQHPNIAQIFDTGLVNAHYSYYVMEYVEGVPITEYCNQRRLNITERIRLFISVCEAVQAAHQQFVIHKDIKPSNILVSASGHIKLLDFGIASIINADKLARGLSVSRSKSFTPAYAAPEQILKQPLGTYTDVYSLGVLLFELLVGARPYSLLGDKLDLSIQNALVLPPSMFFREDEVPELAGLQIIQKRAHTRSAEASKIWRKLKGELDGIVLKALHKNHQNRYKTADSLAQDLQRFLNKRPVSAMPTSVRYRVFKFVSRNNVSLSLIGGIVALGVGFAALHTTRLAIERSRAERALQRSHKVVELFCSEI